MKHLVCIIGSCFVTLFVILSSSFATTYYINIDSGNDSNNGTTIETPFKHLPYDTRFAGSCTPAAGDRFYFKRGTIYGPSTSTTTYLFPSLTSGSEGNPITFGAYGVGNTPVICGGKQIDESQFSVYSGNIYRATNSALGITGIDLYSLYEADKWETIDTRSDWYDDGGDTSPSKCQFYQTGTTAGDYVYIQTSTSATPVGMDMYVMWCQYGFGSNQSERHHLVFENLIIQGFWKYGIFISGSGTYNGYALTVDNCRLSFSEGGLYCQSGPIWAHDSDFTHMIKIEESKGGAFNCGASSDKSGLIEDCRLLRYENGANFTETGPVPHVVRRCIFAGLTANAYQAGMDVAEHAVRTRGNGVEIDIYRCVFYDAGNDFFFDNGPTENNMGPIRFWNNTIYEDRGTGFNSKCIIDVYYTNNWELDMRNNVFYKRAAICNSHSYQTCDPNYAEFWVDHNYYLNDGDPFEIHSYYDAYNGNTRNRFYELTGSGNFKDYITARSAKYSGGIGREEHSVMAASSGASSIFDSTTYGDSNFLRLKIGSALIDAGCTISTDENGIDKDRNTVSGTFDIGAYEYTGGKSFPGVGNSLLLDKECKICSQCGYTSNEFFKVCPNCSKKCEFE